MKHLTAKRAEELKELGYTHIASVVKSYKATTYWHINSIDEIVANGGKWIPAPRGQFGEWYGPIGTSTTQMRRQYPHCCRTDEI